MLDFTVQDVVGWQTNGIPDTFRFQEFIDLRVGKGRITSKEARKIPSAVPSYNWFQHRSPVLSTMHIALAEQDELDIAKLSSPQDAANAGELSLQRSIYHLNSSNSLFQTG
jgi:hypothetical protein